MRASELVAELERERDGLRAENAALRTRLVASGVAHLDMPDLTPIWSLGLTGQETALIAILAAAWPRGLSKFAIEDAMPWQDHAAERSPHAVRHIVWRARRKLGRAAIETICGRGFRLSDTFAKRTRAESQPASRG